MIKTKIAYEDIKAGDLLEVVMVDNGLKTVLTGIAFFERDYKPISGKQRKWWETSDGAIIVVEHEEGVGAIYRIDVREATFDDIREGDLIRVTSTVGDTEQVVTGRAAHLVTADGNWWDSWDTEKGVKLCIRLSSGDVKIEILEREV
jgi:hypothetical protein